MTRIYNKKNLVICDTRQCTGCMACENICPKKCISMATDMEGFLYPQVDNEQCINCGLCKKICPIINVSIPTENDSIVAYAAVLKNTDVRLDSSSGGVFTAIAENVIDKNGVVFGAAFDENFNVIHRYAETKENLSWFRGSKYVQSIIGETYKQAKAFLEQGRTVLFTGTPCQIGGLYSYLGKDYYNLITQDLICHGVPSPMVWRKYLQYRENVSRAIVRRVSFRRKDCGWKTYSVSFEFSNDTEYVAIAAKDPYIQAFLRNLCLRLSCYDCAFKTKYRQADITLADFWGIQNVLPNMDDDKGTSLLIVHSAKGKAVFNEISEKLKYTKVNVDNAINFNSAMIKSVSLPRTRNKFMSDIQHKPFNKMVNKYCKVKLLSKLKSEIKSLLKKFRRN